MSLANLKWLSARQAHLNNISFNALRSLATKDSSKKQPPKETISKPQPSKETSSKPQPSNQPSSKLQPSSQPSSKPQSSSQLSSKPHPSSQPSSQPTKELKIIPCKTEYDIVVVGGGIVGVATAREIVKRHPKLSVAIVEKEAKLACHQTSHNSGVIHAGMYYVPGSMKAKLCTQGMNLLFDYCDEKKILYKRCGKLIVATTPIEVERLNVIHKRGIDNQVKDIKMLYGEEEIKKVEPFCRGLRALWSPHTSIIDYAVVTEYFSNDFKKARGDIHFNFEVISFTKGTSQEFPVVVTSKKKECVKAKYVLTCGGLYSDKLAVMSDCSNEPQIIPFRGEYLVLDSAKAKMIKGNIYPVPDPRFPFLGVHFTPRLDGSVILGPNAVLAFKREGYSWTSVNMPEFLETVTYPGFMKLGLKYIGPGLQEIIKSLITPLQMKDLQKYIPEITASDVKKGPAGVRAQAMYSTGALVDDFVFDTGIGPVGKRILHCRNAPSPAATSSMAIAKMLADRMQSQFCLSQLEDYKNLKGLDCQKKVRESVV